MRWSDARKRKVVNTSDAATVGKLSDVVVDASAATVVGVLLKKTPGDANALMWSAIEAFGVDAVTVADIAALTEPDEATTSLSSKQHEVLGKRVLTTAGEELGKVKDIDFDSRTGTLTALVVDKTEVAASRLISSGSYAVVVRA